MKARRNSSAWKPAIPLRRKRQVVEERLVFVDIELAPVGRRRAILQIAAMAVSRSLVELESFEARIRLDESKFVPSMVPFECHATNRAAYAHPMQIS